MDVAAVASRLMESSDDSFISIDEPAYLLTIIVPVFNEAKTIDELLRKVQSTPHSKQIIVVDDGSTDETPKALLKWCGIDGVEVLSHGVNLGKGTAIRTGLAHAKGRITIIQDADLEYSPSDYSALIAPIVSGTADVVFGSRYLNGSGLAMFRKNYLYLGVRVLNLFVLAIYGVRLTDEATCYKAVPTEMLRLMDLECRRFEFCPEVTAKACKLGARLREAPISYAPRSAADGKKIRIKDGWEAIACLWKWRNWIPRELRRL